MTQGPPPAGLGEHLPQPAPRPGGGAGRAGLLVLVAGVALVAGGALWAAVVGAGPARVDGALLGEAVDARSDPLTVLALVVTHVGSTVAHTLLAAVLAGWAWRRGRRSDAALLVGATVGGVLAFRGLKLLIDRPRPPAATQVISEMNESLPSGHATMATVVTGSLVVLGWAGRGAVGRLVMVVGAALWVGAVGSTRVYLGVHWFSDVVAGWLVGAAWLAVCAALWSGWRRVTPAEPPPPPGPGVRQPDPAGP